MSSRAPRRTVLDHDRRAPGQCARRDATNDRDGESGDEEPQIVKEPKSRADRKATDEQTRINRAWSEHDFAVQQRDENTARLREQRLAKEAAERARSKGSNRREQKG